MSLVTLDTSIEDLVIKFPEAVGFLTRKGIRCIRCGEPVWGLLGSFLSEEGVADPQKLVNELNIFLREKNRSN
jgi:hypothetical protein